VTLLQALRHFAAEAFRNMWRSWKVSLLAIVVTAVSLFLGGSLFLLGSNLARALAGWESEARLVVYMEPGASAEAVSMVEERIGGLEGLSSWRLVTPAEAEEELRSRLPELGDLLDGLEEAPLPSSFEIEVTRGRDLEAGLQAWTEEVTTLPGVAGVDDDRLWMEQIAFAATLLRLGATVIGALLLAGSVFIIASVIRLAALLHREEIRVLRLVGATEFFVRGPFVVQGIVQGLLGSAIAVGSLSVAFLVLREKEFPELLRDLLLSSFLTPVELLVVFGIGSAAGVLGGFLSVRRTAAGLW
jgi:cell division transport system permease protein